MRIKTITEPTTEPITLDEAKLFSRIDTNADDSLVTMLITAARRFCENYCHIKIAEQTINIIYDYRDLCYNLYYIDLGIPVNSINSFTYYNTSNEAAIFDENNYFLSSTNDRLILNNGLPSNSRVYDTVVIEAIAGFETVPEDIIKGIQSLIAYAYQNREAALDSVNGTFNPQSNVPWSLTAFLQPYKLNFI